MGVNVSENLDKLMDHILQALLAAKVLPANVDVDGLKKQLKDFLTNTYGAHENILADKLNDKNFQKELCTTMVLIATLQYMPGPQQDPDKLSPEYKKEMAFIKNRIATIMLHPYPVSEQTKEQMLLDVLQRVNTLQPTPFSPEHSPELILKNAHAVMEAHPDLQLGAVVAAPVLNAFMSIVDPKQMKATEETNRALFGGDDPEDPDKIESIIYVNQGNAMGIAKQGSGSEASEANRTKVIDDATSINPLHADATGKEALTRGNMISMGGMGSGILDMISNIVDSNDFSKGIEPEWKPKTPHAPNETKLKPTD